MISKYHRIAQTLILFVRAEDYPKIDGGCLMRVKYGLGNFIVHVLLLHVLFVFSKSNLKTGDDQGDRINRCGSRSKITAMGFPTSSRHRRFVRNVRLIVSQFGPFLAVLSIGFYLLFKVDVYISRSRAAARYQHVQSPPEKIQTTPTTYNKTRTFRRIQTNGTFDRNFEITWGDENASIRKNGELLTLSLDSVSGSGFESRHKYLFGRIDMQIKLVPGNSAGTVTTYYLSSEAEARDGDTHDEIDFEFLGNSSGEPYTLHTNVFSQGKGKREQQFFLWFDPTADFHTYTIVWNPQRIIFIVDDTPIREFKNAESIGVPFPKDKPMKIYSSLWNADDWATQGGRVKTDWTLAPFIASFQNFSADACIWSSGVSSCETDSPRKKLWFTQKINTADTRKMRKVQKYNLIYDYCRDKWRYPKGPAPECRF